jgi:hypothetical protein
MPVAPDFEPQVRLFREAVLALAAGGDVPSDVVAAALADVLGIAAAQLDRAGGRHALADRLHPFCARVEETYRRARG